MLFIEQVGNGSDACSAPRKIADLRSTCRRFLQPLGLFRSATGKPSTDLIKGALSAGVEAIASSMSKANTSDLVTLASRMSELARELEARRLARTKVVSLDVERERRGR